MNDDDLTTRFHEAFDSAAPDPHLFSRVESAVTRKTLSRRFALVAAAVAVPAVAFAAVAILPNRAPAKQPDVTIDATPGSL